MKKLLFALGATIALAGSAFAQDFVPEPGVKYSFQHKDSEVYLGGRTDGSAGLMSASKANQAAFQWVAEASGDSYLLKNDEGNYMYKSGYSTLMGDASKASTFTFTADGDYYRIIVNGTNSIAPDKVGDGEKVYSDKSLTFPNGLYTIVKSSEISYAASVKLGMASVNIMKDADGENSAALRFTPVNFDGEVTLTASEGFSVDPAKITVTDGEEASVTVKSSAAIGTEGTVTIAYGGNTLATVDVVVVEPAPAYYVLNLETGLALGGDSEKAILTELTREETQQFSKIEVPGSNGARFYLVQKSSGLYFRNVDSGSGVMAHYCEYGPSAERAEWSFPANGEGVSLKNSRQDRIVIPTQLGEGAQLMCYGLTNDPGAKWQLLLTSELGEGEPTVDISDENVLVEPNGVSFTTEVRAYNLNGGYIQVKPSKDVQVSLSTIEESYKRQPLTISTTAKAGTECKIEFVLGNEVLRTLEFTVSNRFPRYIMRYVSEGTDFAMGTEEASAQPILKDYNIDDMTQHMVFVAVDENADGVITEDEGYNILQEGTFSYLTSVGGWDSSFGTNTGERSLFHLERNGDDPNIFSLRTAVGLFNVDDIQAGAKIYCNKNAGTWMLQPIGEISLSNDEVILDSRTATEVIKVTALGLKEAITVTTTGAATANVTTLPAEGGEITVGLKADGTEIAGTVELTSGNFSKTIEVRLKATTLTIDKEAVEITGKGGKAIFNVSATDITEPILITVEGEGFATNVSSIEPSTKVNRDITVTYSGSKEATGKVNVTCAGITKSVAVSVKFNPELIINKDEFKLDNGVAYFSVTAVDIFEQIKITTETEGVEITPDVLEADAEDAYVFVTVPETVPAGTIDIKVATGNIVKTLSLVKEQTGIEAVEGSALRVSAEGGVIRIEGAAEGSQAIVSDLAGRTIVAPAAQPVVLSAKGVYVVKAVAADGAVKTFKVIL